MNDVAAFILGFIFVIAGGFLVLAGFPLVILWAINTIAGASIVYSVKTWCAVWIIFLALSSIFGVTVKVIEKD